MLDTEVLVVGGGPAGSTLARSLTRAGTKVVVMDKARFPRDKVCAGWVTPAVLQELEIDLQEYARDHVLQPIQAFKTCQVGQRQLRSDFPGEPVSYAIRRVEFDDYLLRRCGAELRLGEAFDGMRREGGRWIVNDAIRANLVVGAGGHFCPVARAIGATGAHETAVAAQEIEFEMSAEQRAACRTEAATPELFFTPDLKGYGWVLRKGNHLNIGLGREDKHGLAGHVRRFCAYLADSGRIPRDLPGKFKGHAYLLYDHAGRKLVDDGVILVGDAAGLAYTQSGEGIRPAVESALLAAPVILKCRGGYSAARLQPYAHAIEARLGRRRPMTEEGWRIPPRLRQALAHLLMKNHWFARNLLIKRWFLHTQEPPLPVSAGGELP